MRDQAVPDADDITVTGPSEQAVAATLGLLRQSAGLRWDVNLTKIQGPSTSARFPGLWYRAC